MILCLCDGYTEFNLLSFLMLFKIIFFIVFNILFISIFSNDSITIDGDFENSFFDQVTTGTFLQNKVTLDINYKDYDSTILLRNQFNDVPTGFYPAIYSSDRIMADLRFTYRDLDLKLGHFYDSLGNGLVFKSFNDSLVLRDSNVFGYSTYYDFDDIAMKHFYGSIRNSLGDRPANVFGFEFLKMEPLYDYGVTILSSKSSHNLSDANLYSFLFSSTVDYVDFDIELARNFDTEHSYATYIYVESDWQDINQFSSYSKYSNYFLGDSLGSLYINQAPLGVYQYSLTLPLRNLPNLNMLDQETFHYGVKYDLTSFLKLKSIYSQHYGSAVFYEDVFIQSLFSDVTDSFHFSSLLLSYSSQTIANHRYMTLAQTSTYSLFSDVSLDWDLEYQRRTTGIELRNLLNRFSLSIGKRFFVGLLIENQPDFDKSFLAGNFTFNSDKDTLDVILGSQSADTICSAGVCVNQPEFSGLRMQWNRSLDWDVQQINWVPKQINGDVQKKWTTFLDKFNEIVDKVSLGKLINKGLLKFSQGDVATTPAPVSTVSKDDAKGDDKTVKSKEKGGNTKPKLANKLFSNVRFDEDTSFLLNLPLEDDDGDTLTYQIKGGSNIIASISNNQLHFKALANFHGSEQFNITVSDGTDSKSKKFKVRVNPVNDVPVVNNISLDVAYNDEIVIDLKGNDLDGDKLTYSVVDFPDNGSLIIKQNQAFYKPTKGFVDKDSFTYKVSDFELESDVAYVNMSIQPNFEQYVASFLKGVTFDSDINRNLILWLDASFVPAVTMEPDSNSVLFWNSIINNDYKLIPSGDDLNIVYDKDSQSIRCDGSGFISNKPLTLKSMLIVHKLDNIKHRALFDFRPTSHAYVVNGYRTGKLVSNMYVNNRQLRKNYQYFYDISSDNVFNESKSITYIEMSEMITAELNLMRRYTKQNVENSVVSLNSSGNLYEIIIFDRYLSLDELDILNAYLKKKWGI